MKAKRRSFKAGDAKFFTPMLVPSFSSRGIPDIKKIIEGSREYLSDQLLISAFDLYHKTIPQKNWNFTDLVFLDSGGYEIDPGSDFSDIYRGPEGASSSRWTRSMHQKALDSFTIESPLVLISFDNPRRSVTLNDQISRAEKLFSKYPSVASDILLKSTERKSKKNRDPHFAVNELSSYVEALKNFDIIGLTEKQLGKSLVERMINIRRMRTLLENTENEAPIHIFGSLDPISTVLYFLSGADIFDGLTWLRYGYQNGVATYRHNYAAISFMLDTPEPAVNMHIHQRNHIELKNLESQMKRFLNKHDFSVFECHSELFEKANDLIESKVEEE